MERCTFSNPFNRDLIMAEDNIPQWPSMSPAERTQAYSPSSMVGGNIEPLIQAYVDTSAAAYASVGAVQTLSYGGKPSQTIDLAVPHTAVPVPLHVFIHGGYWQQLSKRESFFAAPETLAQGKAFAAIDYTLAPHASLDEIVAEVVSALEHLCDNATALGIDPRRIVVSGSSAGAHLAAMAAKILPANARPRGLVLMSGIYDLRPLLDIYVNDALGMDMDSAERNSPALLDVSDFPPSVVAWGDNETDEFKRQSRQFAGLLRAAGSTVETLEVPSRNHFDIVHDLVGDTPLGRRLMQLVEA